MRDKPDWLKSRREAIELKQDELAAKLQLAGFDVSRATISHWETGRHEPPMHDSGFRQALAKALRLNVPTMLRMAGYEVTSEPHSETAEIAAHLVDQLPPDKQRLALKLLETLAETSV